MLQKAASGLIMMLLIIAARSHAMEKNYWQVEDKNLRFASAELTMAAELPHGWISLKVNGHEFLGPGDTYGAITFRKPSGDFVTAYTEITNISHDALFGRVGAVADGLYLLKFTTGWSLPVFSLYAGFNVKEDHDLVFFWGPEVVAVRLGEPEAAASQARRIFRPGDKEGLAEGNSAIIVHESGTALRIKHKLRAGIAKTPDGQNRLAVVIRCQGLAANNVALLYDTHNASDNLLVCPQVDVQSPTMGQADPGYKPQSNGWWSLYEKDAQVDYIFSFGWLGRKPFVGKALIEARHALGQSHFSMDKEPERAGEQDGIAQYRAVLRPQFTLPGVSDMNLFLLDSTGVALYVNRLRFMYDWPSYKPTYNAQPDMKKFWDKTLAELRSIPLDAKVEKQHFKDDPKWEFYHVSFAGWRGKRIHALLYVPKTAAKPCPAIVTAHPGTLGWGVNTRPDGVYGSEVKNDPRFVTIVPLVRGFEPDAKDVPFNQPWWGPLDSRDDYVARSWFCALIRAVDYLESRPELVDSKRIIAKGGSQGGALALALAALDQRIAACLADSPSNCMHGDAVRPGTYGTFGPTSGQVPPGQTLDDLLKTLSYYDPANMAPWIQCPTVIHVTVGDLTVHSMGGLGVFKNLTSLPEDKKWFLPGSNGHYHSGSYLGGKKEREICDMIAGGSVGE